MLHNLVVNFTDAGFSGARSTKGLKKDPEKFMKEALCVVISHNVTSVQLSAQEIIKPLIA